MKTLLVVASDSAHRTIYEKGLEKHFRLLFSSQVSVAEGPVDAVIYDIPGTHGSVDLRWLKTVDLPVVVLTPEDDIPSLTKSNCRVLTYPADIDRILKALCELAVEASSDED